MLRKTDKDGNILQVQNSGIYLKLKSEFIPRKIFSFSGNKIVKYVKNNNIMRTKPPLIGFNYHALQMIQDYPMFKSKYIYIIMKKKMYRIDSFKVLNHKEFLHFKKEGFELQCFYPVNLLEEWNK